MALFPPLTVSYRSAASSRLRATRSPTAAWKHSAKKRNRNRVQTWPALSLPKLRQVTVHEHGRFAPIDVFQAVHAGAELVQQTILNPPAMLCDRIRNAMERDHRIFGHVEAGKSGFQCQVYFLLEKEMRTSHAVPHFDKVL